jgi:SAM-dependent methyltransferase
MLRFLLSAFLLLASSLPLAQDQKTGGPFVPTPQGVVDAMLELAEVTPRDFVIDLGSGDGRIVLTAAKRYNARGLGIDIDKELVDQSNAEARKIGVADRVTFRKQDVLEARIEEATVLTLYLLPGMMNMLQPKILRELKPGTRIVSHDFPLGDWKADRERVIDVPEKYGSPGNWKSTLYYWLVPAKVAGPWDIKAPGTDAEMLTVNFEQQFQFLQGAATIVGKSVPVSGGRVSGSEVVFTLMLPKGKADFRGVANGNRIKGELVYAGRSFAWSGMRPNPPATALR